VTNAGTTTSTYEALFNVPNVEALIESGNYQFQVLITRTSLVPGLLQGPDACHAAAKTQVHVIANIPVPQISTPQISTISNPQISTPQISTPQIATFSVAPYNGAEGQNSHGDEGNEDSHSTALPDEVKVTLRAIRLRPLAEIRAEGGPEFEPAEVQLRVQAESTNVVLGVVEPDGSQPRAIGLPDFVIAGYTNAVPALAAAPGGEVTLSSWTLRNQGATASGAPIQIGYYLSVDPEITAGDTLLAAALVASPPGGGELAMAPATLTIPPATPAGSYYVGVLADAANAVLEADESNNAVSEPIDVSSLAARIFVVHPGSGSEPGAISVLDVATQEVIDTIEVGVEPSALAIAGTRAYVANFGSDSVSIVDLMTHEVIGTIEEIATPTAIALDPAGTRAYVVDAGGAVMVIDTATLSVIATVAVGSSPGAIALAPGGSFLYVTNRGSNTVSRLDLASNEVTATIPVGSMPSGVAFHPGGRAYVTNTLSDSVSVIDAATSTVVATIPVGAGPTGVAAAPDGAELYVSSFGSASISRINPDSNTVIGTIPFPTIPYGVAFTATHAYVAAYIGSAVVVIDRPTGEVTGTVETLPFPTAVVLKP